MSSSPNTYLGDLAEFINGDRGRNYPSEGDYSPEGIPFISAADLNNDVLEVKSAKHITREAFDRLRSGKIAFNDILFCLRGSLGKSARVAKSIEGAIASSLVILRAKPHTNPVYLHYLIRSPLIQSLTGALDNGSVQPNLSVREVKKIEVPALSESDQVRIAETLKTFDDKIELNRRMNETLEAMARAIFKSWFVDFDPVRAKSEGRQPQGIPAHIADLFPNSFQDSPLGPIPKGWDTITLGKFCRDRGGDVQTGPFGSQLHASDYVVDGVPVVMPKDILHGRVSTATVARIPESKAVDLSKHRMRPGDVVFSRRGDVGRCALIGSREDRWLCGTGCLRVRPGESISDALYIYRWLNLPTSQEWIVRHAVGATMPNLNTKILSDVPVVCPSDPVISAFCDWCEPLVSLQAANSAESETLASVRDTLLPKLLSGELSITTTSEATS